MQSKSRHLEQQIVALEMVHASLVTEGRESFEGIQYQRDKIQRLIAVLPSLFETFHHSESDIFNWMCAKMQEDTSK